MENYPSQTCYADVFHPGNDVSIWQFVNETFNCERIASFATMAEPQRFSLETWLRKISAIYARDSGSWHLQGSIVLFETEYLCVLYSNTFWRIWEKEKMPKFCHFVHNGKCIVGSGKFYLHFRLFHIIFFIFYSSFLLPIYLTRGIVEMFNFIYYIFIYNYKMSDYYYYINYYIDESGSIGIFRKIMFVYVIIENVGYIPFEITKTYIIRK